MSNISGSTSDSTGAVRIGGLKLEAGYKTSQSPSFSTAASNGIPSLRSLASMRRRFIVTDLSRYRVSRSDSISRHSEIGTITAVASPLSSVRYWISASAIDFSVRRAPVYDEPSAHHFENQLAIFRRRTRNAERILHQLRSFLDVIFSRVVQA